MSEFFKELEEETLRDTKLNLDRAQNPDQSAKIYNLSDRTGFPPDYVERNTNEVQSQVDYDDLSPLLADFLRERKNAEVSRDDLENLKWWETVGREAKNVGKIGQAAALTASGGLYAATGSLFDLASDITTAPFTPFMSPEEIKEQDLFGAAGRYLGGIGQAEIAKGQRALPKPGETYVPAPVISGVQSFFTNLTALGAGLATRNPNTALAIMGTQTYGTSYARAKDAGLSNYNAFTFALSDGMAEVVTERIPAFKLFDDLAKDTGLVKTILGQMAREIPTEQAATLWQDANAWAAINPDKTLSEFVAERPGAAVDTLISTVVATGLQTASISAINKLTREQSQIQQMADKAKESKVLQRSPDVFAQHLQNVVEEYGQADIYLNAEEVGSLLNQEALEDGPEIALIREQLAEAQALGGDIVIPIEQAGPLLASKNYETLKPLMRLSPEYEGEADAAAILAEASQNVDLKTRADEIYAEVSQQLIETGRLTPAAAKTSATLIPAYVTTKAARTGLTVDEVYEMMGLKIVGPEAELTGAVLDQALEDKKEAAKTTINTLLIEEKVKPEDSFRGTSIAELQAIANLEELQVGRDFEGQPGISATLINDGQFPVYGEGVGILVPEQHTEASGRASEVLVNESTDPKDLRYVIEGEVLSFEELQEKYHDPDFKKEETEFFEEFLGKELFQDELGFFSGLSDAVGKLKQESGPAQQMLNTIKKQPGVKAEELEWTGLAEYLSAKKESGEKVTKQEIQDFVDSNGVQIEEVRKGAGISQESEDVLAQLEDREPRDLGGRTDADGTKFQDYQLPGGENYREVLLTLPAKQFDSNELKRVNARLKELDNSYNPETDYYDRDSGKEPTAHYREYTELTKRRIELEKGTPAESKQSGASGRRDEFKSTHFDEPNILAHVRLNDRIDSDGNKVLFVEEIQSDYGQDARKKGIEKRYKPEDVQPLIEGLPEASQPELFWYFRVPDNVLQIPKSKYKTEAEAKDYVVREKLARTGVPNAPFIGSTNAWAELAIKRILRIASEEGYDSVSWTTGEQQADRYDLSEKVEAIGYRKHGDEYELEITDKNLNEINLPQSRYKADELDSVVGKEIAEKIINGEGESNIYGTSLSGVDLKIGGEGMRGFYDRTLPNIFKKVARKLDKSAKVSVVDLPDIGEVFNVSLTDKAKGSALEGQPLFQDEQKGVRGKILLLPDSAIIQLTEASNLSTFLHESGHLFLAMEEKIYGHPKATPQIKADGDEILKWLGVESFADLNRYEVDPKTKKRVRTKESTDALEKFARGFERYLSEGKAPSIGLQSAFRRFAAWLKQVYRDLTRLNVELNDEVRGVMDRMLATDQEIDRVKGNFDPLFESAEDAGMTQAEYKTYSKQSTSEGAKELLQTKMVKQLERTYKKWWKDESAVVAKGVREELIKNPLYSATETLKSSEGPKLSKAKVHAELGQITPRFRGMTAEDGMDSDDLAALFGFASGNELIHVIEESPTLAQETQRLTESEMVRRHGDILNDGTIQEEAEAAVRNPERARKLITELNAIARKNNTNAIDRDALKVYAKETIAKLPFSKIRPAQYRSAEIRAAKQSVEAKNKGDFGAAQKAKTQELMNFYLSREATQVREKTLRIRASLQSIKGRKFDSKKYNNEIVNEAKVLISVFDFRKSNRESVELAEARLKGVRNWIESQQKDPDTYLVEAEILGKLTAWNDMTSEDLRGLNDIVTSIIKSAKLVDTEAYKANIDQGREWLKENRIENYETEVDTDTPWVKAKRITQELFSSLRKMESLVRQADGMNEQGWLWKQTIKPLLDASTTALTMRTDAHKHLNEMFEGYENAFNGLRDKRTFTLDSGRKVSLSYGARLSLALNMGNESNREALLNQEKLLPDDQPLMTENDLDKIVATLSDKDWDLVQNVWDYIDTYWKDISALEIRRSGAAPEKVQPAPFVTSSGKEMKGGYYPLVGDPLSDPKQQEIDTQYQSFMAGGAAKLSTKHGSTIERVGFGGRKVDLSVNVLFNHIDGVIHDLTHWEPVRDVSRVLKNRKIKSELITSLGLAGEATITNRLKEVASGPQKINGLRGIERFLRHARLAATYSALGYSVRTSLMNTLGLTTGIAELDAKIVAAASVEFYANPNKMSDFIQSKSEYMVNRGEVINRDIAQIRQNLKGNTAFNKIKNNAFGMMTLTDRAITRPIWLAAYRQGESMFETEQEAIDHADRVVARTQGSGLDLDLANVETRSELMKTMTVMFSAMSAIYNISVEQVKRYKAGKISKTDLLLKMGWLIVIPGIVEMLISGGGDDEPAKEITESVVYYGLGLFPLIREGASYAKYGSSFPTPAAQLATYPFEAMDLVYDTLHPDEEVTKKEMMRFLSSTAGVFHVPGGRQFERTAGYLIDLQDNEIDEFSPYGLIVTGKE